MKRLGLLTSVLLAFLFATAFIPVHGANAPDPTTSRPSAAALSALRALTTPMVVGPRYTNTSTAIAPVRIAIDAPPVAITAAKSKAVTKPRVKRSASRSAKPARASAAPAPRGGGWSTIASWYDDRPAACWDKKGRHGFPRGLRIWTAHKTLPCGTMIVVTGSTGTMSVRVYDRGPYVRGRALDLSAAAFRGVCGSTSRGVCRVTYRVGG